MSPREALAKRVVASPAPVLAPLTRAGTAPFRALCRRHGADATMGEMIFARQLCKGDRREQARLRRPEAETLFGAQIATNQISEGVAACVLAEEAGAAWVDLNCGCPIYEATRRGLGSALLRKPAKLARLVGGLVEGSPLPVSVKIRLSPAGNKDVNALEHIEALAALDPVWKSTCVSGAASLERNRHRHAIEQASRRWREAPRNLISTQARPQAGLRDAARAHRDAALRPRGDVGGRGSRRAASRRRVSGAREWGRADALRGPEEARSRADGGGAHGRPGRAY